MDWASRRAFVKRISALAAGSLFSHVRSTAQNPNPRRIDVHHHFTPPEYLQFLRAHNQGGGGVPVGRGGALNSAYPGWALSEDLEDMDRSGAATAILSITTPGFYFGEFNEKRRVIRECNEYAAKLRSDHPGRFGSFAAIPALDAEGALREIEYALDTLKADGIGVFSNYATYGLGTKS